MTPEMYNIFDWSVANRRMHYGNLKKAVAKIIELEEFLYGGQLPDGCLDIGVRDPLGECWIAVARPGMADIRPDFPRRDLDLVEYLIEWAAGVKHDALAEICEMDARYPELANLRGKQLMPDDRARERSGAGNWLKRAFKSILK
jgi:hypothetical protein